jgi:PilZ domain-containing protein
MPEPQPDRRATRRFPLQLPVSVRGTQGGMDAIAQTRDVSSRGICFFTDPSATSLETGSLIEFTLTLPPEVTLTEAIKVRCKGKIVRVDRVESDRLSVAAQIQQYEFVGDRA